MIYNKNKGFTLIELLVVMAIFAVVSATVMANYKTFGHKTLLKNLAYSIALTVREAQVSGLTGRNFTSDSDSEYYSSYGVFFTQANPKQYIFFRDLQSIGNEHKYDNGAQELVRTYSILGGRRITRLCTYSSVGGNCNNASELHVTFKRPQPDAYIYTDGAGPFARADIEITSPEGEKIYVIVEAAGQISVSKTP